MIPVFLASLVSLSERLDASACKHTSNTARDQKKQVDIKELQPQKLIENGIYWTTYVPYYYIFKRQTRILPQIFVGLSKMFDRERRKKSSKFVFGREPIERAHR